MSILDIEDKYPDNNFWLENGFFDLHKPGLWIWCGPKHLHWKISDTWSRFGNVNIRVIYNKYKKDLEITQGNTSLFGDHDDEVDFEPVILHKPTQHEIELALTNDFLSSRLTYKHNK